MSDNYEFFIDLKEKLLASNKIDSLREETKKSWKKKNN